MTLPNGFFACPFAHRGLHDRAAGRVENSPSAIRAAAQAGYGVEIDVQLSRDGRAMVFHDAHLDRLTGATGPLRDHDADDLKELALCGGQDRIPMLEDILPLVATAPLLVEIKDQTGAMAPMDGQLEHATAKALRGHCGPVAVMSFNPHAMATIKTLAPDLPRGLVTCAFGPDWDLPDQRRAELRRIEDVERVGAVFISHGVDDLDMPRVAALQAQGLGVNCWTVRDRDTETRARQQADTITFEGFNPALS